jgi:hypothetical protein
MQTIHGVTSMSMSHAAILPNCDAFTRRAQLRMTLCLVCTGLQASRGFLVRFGHLPVFCDVIGAMRIDLCRIMRRRGFGGGGCGLRKRARRDKQDS